MNDLHSLRVAFMSEKGQGLQPYQMQDKWLQIQSSGEIKIGDRIFHFFIWRIWTKYFSLRM